MLILSGITINTLVSENGIIKQVLGAKEQTEIASEKEQIEIAMTAMSLESEENLIERKVIFQGLLDSSFGENKTKAYINGNGYAVHILSTNRIYMIDETGNITKENSSILNADVTPGAFDGSGTQDDPYMIMSIEDLLEWSENYNTYKESYIKLGKTLDFKSELSYCDYNRTDYNTFLGINNRNCILLEILGTENYSGFKPILEFKGDFNGQGYEIKNIYENITGNAGLIDLIDNATIKNLKVSGKINSLGSNFYIGIIARARGDSTLENIVNNCHITAEGSYAGGICGIYISHANNLYIKNCINIANLNCGRIAGGIIGIVYAPSSSDKPCVYIYNSLNIGTIYVRLW